ncbi:lysine-specific demethylase hairless isoform X2 [Struthio camelus]|uniref:lysine-specific demethylase hairless isoform X2 n=1 Tax=Struthio camelus TaxID=8801 RepID=UPI0036041316
MASDAGMEEALPRWRMPQEAAQDTRVMESSGAAGALPRTAAAELGLMAPGYQEPVKLGYGPGLHAEKGHLWRGSAGCPGLGREPAGGRLGCAYPPAHVRDALCRLPRGLKDGADLQLLLEPRNGQPKAGWAAPGKERRGPRWPEAVLAAPLALYSHAYRRYPLPLAGLESQRPGKPRCLAEPAGGAGDGASDPPALRHCPFLVEATLAERSPFLVSALLPADPAYGSGLGGAAADGPGALGEGCYAAADWHLAPYAPPWGQPLYLSPPPRRKAPPAPFGSASSSGNEEFYPKKEPGLHLLAKDPVQSQLLGRGQAGTARQDGDGELPAAAWGDGRARDGPPAPAPDAPPPPASPGHAGRPLFLPQPSAPGGSWAGTRPHAADFPPEPAPGRPSKPKDESLTYQSLQPGSPLGPREPEPSPLLTDGPYPLALSKPELPSACPCATLGCERCPGVGCRALGPFAAPAEAPGPDGEAALGAQGGRFACPPGNHTKLKKTWLTRHSEQSSPRCKALRREGPGGAPEAPVPPGKRSAKRPHGSGDGPRGAGEGAGAAKRGTKAVDRAGAACPGAEERAAFPEERKMELGEGGARSCAGAGPRRLQSVPCTALPASIPRCCACAARAQGGPGADGEEDDPPESACRLLHFRRFAFGAGGELSVDGFCTLDEAEGETLHLDAAGKERRSKSASSSLCLAKYLLSVLGDPFCEAVRRDREAWLGAHGGHERVTAWRRGEGAPQLCDACQRGLFNSHWSCARCGFQLCPDCHRGRRQEAGQEDPARPAECVPGQDHDVGSLVPTQFVPIHVLTELWKLLHEVRAKFAIQSRCPCGAGAAEQGPAEAAGSRQEKLGKAMPRLQPSSDGEADTSRPIKEESPELGPRSPGGSAPRGAVQTATLCDLLASTAIKLCLGHAGVRMAFAPVSPASPSDTRLTNILDSIIARVVERKIQERQGGREPGGRAVTVTAAAAAEPHTSHCLLAPGGLLWLHDPNHATNYKLFQEHWRQGQPVLVSGLQKTLDGRLWGPESLWPAGGEQEVEAVNLRAQPGRVRLSSKEFWDGFAASATCPELEPGGDLLKLESGFGDMQLCQAANLSASLPLLEYCGPDGRLNLASYLRGERGWHWLRPRICVAYGVRPEDRTIGTKNLTVEVADSISVLVHAGASLPDRPELLLQAEEDGMDVLLKERLWDASSRPGALWHIFRAEDAGRIRDFLQKACQDHERDGAAQPEPAAHRGCYLDLSLRRRLREECGVSSWTLLQFLGDAVLVPAGAPHQVQTLTGTVSVEQRFLSPENATRLRDHSASPAGAARRLRAQMDGMIFSAVREAVGVLQGCK